MAISKGAKVRAEQAVQSTLAQADAVVTLSDADGEAARKELLRVLREADVRLAKKLAALSVGKGELRFTAAQAIAFRTQIQLTIAHVEGKLGTIAEGAGEAAIGKSVADGQKVLAKLEQAFKNVSVNPSVMAAMQQSHVLRGPKAALVTRVATSLDRYGMQMGTEFSRILQVGLASGASNEEMVAALVKHGGPRGPKVSLAAREDEKGIVTRIREGNIPEGLFVRHRYWAERIVRTEIAYAYNGTRYQSLLAMRAEGMEVKKKIVAVFDTRTAPDSIAVHGQVRELEDMFLDGAGRVYLHPPARPNDRETILPWFDDWAEVPSTEPPTEAERVRAEELENPPARGTDAVLDTPPADLEHYERLKVEAANAQRREQAGADAQRATQDLESDRQTRAATLLLSYEREKIAAARDQVLAQQAKADAAAKAKQDKKLAKWDTAFVAALKSASPHEAHLMLYELAGTDPAGFAEILNGYYTGIAPLESKTIVAALGQHHEVLDAMVLDAVKDASKFFSQEDLTGALDAWKKTPAFHSALDELAGKKDAKSRRRLAALIHSEQPLFLSPNGPKALTWAESQARAKKPQPAVQKLKDKYPIAVAKEWVIKPEGGTSPYYDVFDPDTHQKTGYFQKVAGQFVVDPSLKLPADKWQKRSFPDATQAAAYAAQVGSEIQKLKGTTPVYEAKKPLDTTRTKRFNHAANALPSTVIGPMKLAGAAAKEVAAVKRRAVAHFQKEGRVKTRRIEEDNAVDAVLEQEGLTYQQHKWSSRYGSQDCWYTSSEGPKAYVGRFLTADTKLQDARAIVAEDLKLPDRSDAMAQKFIAYARAKYAATQAALEHRIASGELTTVIDRDGYITLYRGIKHEQARDLRLAREQGESTVVDFRSVSSWSTDRDVAERFSDHNNIVVQARVHYTRIFSQYEQEEIAMRRYGDREAEWIVVADEEEYTLVSTDITNRYPE